LLPAYLAVHRQQTGSWLECCAPDPGLKNQARGKTGIHINGDMVPANRNRTSVEVSWRLSNPLIRTYNMIKNKLKLSLLATAMACAVGVSGVSMAHTAAGTLAANGAAIDVYHTSCFTWHRLRF
jgi:hypothetical protein